MGCGYSKENQLYEAVRKGDAKHVHKLLKAGISHTGSVDSVGSTLLHVAGQLGHAGVIDELCEVSSLEFIGKKNAHGFTALHEAAITGNVKAIQALIEAGANVNSAGPKENTALHLAAGKGMNTAVKTLVLAGANLNAHGQLKERPLHTAARKGKHETSLLLLELGADPAVLDEDGNMPWQLAAKGVLALNPNRSPDDPQDQSLANLLRPDKMPPQRLDETSIVSFWMSNSRKFHVPRDRCVPPSMRTPDDEYPHPYECGTVRAGVGTETAHTIFDDDMECSIDFWQEDGMTMIHLSCIKRHVFNLAAASFYLVERGFCINQVEIDVVKAPREDTFNVNLDDSDPSIPASKVLPPLRVGEEQLNRKTNLHSFLVQPLEPGTSKDLAGMQRAHSLGANMALMGIALKAATSSSINGKMPILLDLTGKVAFTYAIVDGSTGEALPEDTHQEVCAGMASAIQARHREYSDKQPDKHMISSPGGSTRIGSSVAALSPSPSTDQEKKASLALSVPLSNRATRGGKSKASGLENT